MIVLSGAGTAFCSGYDLADRAEASGSASGRQEMPWNPMKDYAFMMRAEVWSGERFKPIVPAMQVIPVPCLSDNYAYLVIENDRAAVVDPRRRRAANRLRIRSTRPHAVDDAASAA